ncbi:uncharacterized protein [Nothobranchius furzeri]|uniref:uncharacterized protein isoform X2 n=1 Tax=Nothobranchius furzeri TaxID=105023 RepID=UPI0039048C66
MEKTGRDLEFFSQLFMGNCCGIFMLMYAVCICTSSPPSFTEEEMPAIRLWWCIQLMERFGIEGLRPTGVLYWSYQNMSSWTYWTRLFFTKEIQPSSNWLWCAPCSETLCLLNISEDEHTSSGFTVRTSVFAHGAGSQNSTENSTLTCTLLRSVQTRPQRIRWQRKKRRTKGTSLGGDAPRLLQPLLQPDEQLMCLLCRRPHIHTQPHAHTHTHTHTSVFLS